MRHCGKWFSMVGLIIDITWRPIMNSRVYLSVIACSLGLYGTAALPLVAAEQEPAAVKAERPNGGLSAEVSAATKKANADYAKTKKEADESYTAARRECQAQPAEARRQCLKEADAARTKTIADAKAARAGDQRRSAG
jgi:hypothetical protein